MITDRRSIFIQQPKTRSAFWLQGEMKWGTALITDAVPKTLQDYENTSVETLSHEPLNIIIPHQSVQSLVMKGDKPTFRTREFWVKWTMQRQKEVFQVYNFTLTYINTPNEPGRIQFYAVPLGAYFKPKRQTQTRQTILQDYAEEIIEAYRKILPRASITAQFINEPTK